MVGIKKKEVYKAKPLTEGKKDSISALIDEYGIEIAVPQVRNSPFKLQVVKKHH